MDFSKKSFSQASTKKNGPLGGFEMSFQFSHSKSFFRSADSCLNTLNLHLKRIRAKTELSTEKKEILMHYRRNHYSSCALFMGIVVVQSSVALNLVK